MPATSVEQVCSVAFGHGVTASLLGQSEDHALRTWAQVAHEAGYPAGVAWSSVRNGWRMREACTYRPATVGIRAIVARGLAVSS
jgi:hypothetical protein